MALISVFTGIGIDDMFVINQCWRNLDKNSSNKDLNLPHKVAKALRHAGVSITITTSTDVLAFGVGAFSVSLALFFGPNFLAFRFLGDARPTIFLHLYSSSPRINILTTDYLVHRLACN